MNFAEDLKYVIQQFKAEGITDLILDLRFNNGGSVELARYLAASIAGTSHRSDVFPVQMNISVLEMVMI